MSSNQIERRTVTNEVRAADPKRLTGLAARYNSRTKIGNEFFEEIKPGAFRSCIQRGDSIALLRDHDPSLIMSRTPDSLSVKDTAEGLAFDATLPDMELSRSTVALIQSRALQGCSFSFQLAPSGDDSWSQIVDPETGKTIPLRSIKNFSRIWDISICTNPQYAEATFVSARALLEARSVLSHTSESERERMWRRAALARLRQVGDKIKRDAADDDDDPDDFDPNDFTCPHCGAEGELRCARCGEPVAVQKTD